MQRGKEDRNDFFGMGDPFGNFQGFGMMPSLFGGRDPFDDPFFTRPFGSMLQSSRFESSNSGTGDASETSSAKGVVIEEVNSDDEGEKEDNNMHIGNEKNNYQKHADSNKQAYVEHPDDDPAAESKGKSLNHRNDHNRTGGTGSQSHSFNFQTSRVTYGGIDGAYYTSTRTRRMGSDGVVIEESKEADKTTGQASHRISRGIHDKGHSVMRKLNSDGKVDTMQTLHNLNEDELAGFEEAWQGNVKRRLPGRSDQFNMHNAKGSSSFGQKKMTSRGGWALPSIDRSWRAGGRRSEPSNVEARTDSSGGRTKNVVRINIE